MGRQIVILDWNCSVFPCKDDCCRFGADVWPDERENLIQRKLAKPDDFTGPERDVEGDLLYRTGIGKRGCVFLNDERGCRLHDSGHKPEVCRVVPRDPAEAEEMFLNGYLPCYPARLVPQELQLAASPGDGGLAR